MTADRSQSGYWDMRYQLGETHWDIGSVSPPLKIYFEQLTNKQISILIPGCGNGYEASWLLQNGFRDVTILDISPLLTQKLKIKFEKESENGLKIVTCDFFRHHGNYDLIIEQTFFCALDPHLRDEYVKKMDALLKPGGKLAGVLFNRSFAGGPPFGGSKQEYEQLFSRCFTIQTLSVCMNSIKPREGTELFFIVQKDNTATSGDVKK